jgi:hypothetical protein
MGTTNRRAPTGNLTVTLRRTFNISMPLDLALSLDPIAGHKRCVRFWRVEGPIGHPSLGSDLSLQGLREWRIIE